MAKYYYLLTYLPSLSLDEKPEISFGELNTLLKDNLPEKDYAQTKILRRFFDLLNLRALWLKQPLDLRGELTDVEIEEALFNQIGFPDYVYDFLVRYETREDRLRHFSFLLARFFQTVDINENNFLRKYLNFERELRLVLVGLRAHTSGRDLDIELQYEDSEEELVVQLLSFKNAKSYEPPERYNSLKEIFENSKESPLTLAKAIDAYRLSHIDSLVELNDMFSFEHVLAYIAKFMIIDNWFRLDKQKGAEIVNTIVGKISHGTSDERHF